MNGDVISSDPTRAVVERHLADWQRGDVAALLADYAQNAVLLHAAMGVVTGKAALGAMLEQVFGTLFPPHDTVLTIETMVVTADAALVHYTARTPQVVTQGAFDAFTLRDGLIIAQFSGGQVVAVT